MKRIVPTSLLTLAGAALLVGCGESQSSTTKLAAPKPPVVMVASPTSDYIIDYEEFTGRTDAEFTVTVRARVNGYLDKIGFQAGEEVKEGDLLYVIDPRHYEAEVARAGATLAQSEAHLTARSTPTSAGRKTSSVGGTSAARSTTSSRATAPRRKPRSESPRRTATSPSSTSGSPRSTRPISGRLSRTLVDAGNLVKADDTVLTSIVSLDPMFVYFEVDERTVLKFRRLIQDGKLKSRSRGRSCRSTSGCRTRRGSRTMASSTSATTGSIRTPGRCRSGPSSPTPPPVSSRPACLRGSALPVGDPHKSILIPEQAIGTDQGKKFLYVVNDKNEVVYRPDQGRVAEPGPAASLTRGWRRRNGSSSAACSASGRERRSSPSPSKRRRRRSPTSPGRSASRPRSIELSAEKLQQGCEPLGPSPCWRGFTGPATAVWGASFVIPRFFIDRPIFAAVLSIVITLAGGIALFTLPIAQYPPDLAARRSRSRATTPAPAPRSWPRRWPRRSSSRSTASRT